jgi:hypothetical protein
MWRPHNEIMRAYPRRAAQVYGIDVGFNQLADKIRRDERVVVVEKFNLRHLGPQHLPCKVRYREHALPPVWPHGLSTVAASVGARTYGQCRLTYSAGRLLLHRRPPDNPEARNRSAG